MASITRRERRSTSVDGLDIQARLLAALEKLVAEGDSFTSLSVERLIKEAGVSRATFYTYFQDKGDLLAHVLSKVRSEIHEAAMVWFVRAGVSFERDGKVSEREIREATIGFLKVISAHEALLSAILETATYDRNVKSLVDEMMLDVVTESMATMKSIKAAGFANPGANRHVVEILAWTLLNGGLAFIRGADGRQISSIAQALTHIFCAALFSAGSHSGT